MVSAGAPATGVGLPAGRFFRRNIDGTIATTIISTMARTTLRSIRESVPVSYGTGSNPPLWKG
jgi:hypothetical protein